MAAPSVGAAPRGWGGGRIVGLLLVVLALGLVALGVYRILEDRVLTATAEVEVVSASIDEGFDTRYATQDICNHVVRYVERPDVTAVVSSGATCRGVPGDVLTVYHDPDDPGVAAFEGGSYAWGDLAGILVLALVVAFPGWILLKPPATAASPTPPPAAA